MTFCGYFRRGKCGTTASIVRALCGRHERVDDALSLARLPALRSRSSGAPRKGADRAAAQGGACPAGEGDSGPTLRGIRFGHTAPTREGKGGVEGGAAADGAGGGR